MRTALRSPQKARLLYRKGGLPVRERESYLDALRCFAMFCVVLLHTQAPVLICTDYYGLPSWRACMLLDTGTRMGVPLFFMLSGYLMLSRPETAEFRTFYGRRLPKLLVPLLAWNGIYYLADGLLYGEARSLSGFLAGVLDQGCSYHMWFAYTLAGIYLLCPFLRRTAGQCTPRQQLLLIVLAAFPSGVCPYLHIHLFDPLLSGFLGYFLAGLWLGSRDLGRGRYVLYGLGAAAYLMGTLGNLLDASPAAISLPWNGGYLLHHYFTSGAVFVWVKTFFARHRARLAPLAGGLARLSGLMSGVYWAHILVLNVVSGLTGSGLTVFGYVAVRLAATAGISLAIAWAASRIPAVGRVLLA